MIEAILWDNDGVLVDTEGLYYEANRLVLEEVGVELTHALFADYSLRQGRTVFDLVEGLAADEFERLRRRRNARYEALIAEGVRVFEGVEECLSDLHGRLPMAIVTSSNAEHFDSIHAQTGLLRYFEFALKNGDYDRHKPHPEPYLTAASRLGLEPEQCLVVEDTERGLQAAVAAGMRCLVIPHALSSFGDFSAAHAVLDEVREVPAVLARLVRGPRSPGG
jgi:HAD superfamily hydrolase (TIGR01509 family)